MPKLRWKETPDGDYEAVGFCIVRQYTNDCYALYRTNHIGNCQGDCYKIGALQECKDKAEELRNNLKRTK